VTTPDQSAAVPEFMVLTANLQVKPMMACDLVPAE
jgi:hypothetical protein